MGIANPGIELHSFFSTPAKKPSQVKNGSPFKESRLKTHAFNCGA
jgi:hypothetical protein